MSHIDVHIDDIDQEKVTMKIDYDEMIKNVEFKVKELIIWFKSLNFINENNCNHIERKFAHMSMLGVSDDFKRQGLTNILTLYALKALKEKSYQFSMAELISPYTIKTFENNLKVFKRHKYIKFGDFEY